MQLEVTTLYPNRSNPFNTFININEWAMQYNLHADYISMVV